MDSDYDGGHGLPSDFPSDPSYGGFYLAGGLLTLVLIALLAAAIVGFLNGQTNRRRTNFDDWPKTIALFIKRKCNEVIRDKSEPERATGDGVMAFLFGDAARRRDDRGRRDVRDIDPGRAGRVAGHVRALIGGNLKLGKEINGELKSLSEALEGYREIKDPALVAGVGGAVNGAVINIAVNTGPSGNGAGDPVQVMGGPYAPGVPAGSSVPAPHLAPPLVIDRQANIWLAFNKFRDDWSHPDVMAGLLKSAQGQVCVRPPDPPRPIV